MISHVYSVVPVSDRTTAIKWYEVFFGHPADEVIGEEYLWKVSETAYVVIDDRSVRAGSHAQITFGVEGGGLDDILSRLADHGIQHEPVETYSNGVRHVVIEDPDGNKMSLAEFAAQ